MSTEIYGNLSKKHSIIPTMEHPLLNGMDLDEVNPIPVYGNETVYERLVRDALMNEIVWRALFVKGRDRRGGRREIWDADKEIRGDDIQTYY